MSIRINLAKLNHVIMDFDSKKEQGKKIKCIVMPIEENQFFLSEKQNVFMDLIEFQLKNPKPDSEDTHIIKQSLSAKVREKMSQEEKNAMPIIGNAKLYMGGTPDTPAAANEDLARASSNDDGGDLPF